MKKLFRLIGLFLALFSILFFFYVADKKDIFKRSEMQYDFTLSAYITGEALEKLAKESDVTVQLKEFKNVSFGHDETIITWLNPDKDLKEGVQLSVFPKQKYIYKRMDKNQNRKIQFFTVVESDTGKIQKLQNLLEKENIKVDDIFQEEINPFGVKTMLNTPNLRFFSQIFLLAVLCIASYYVHRSKEIGILKLNGWSVQRISLRLFKTMMFQTLAVSFLVMGLFSVYILKMDASMFGIYMKLCSYLIVMLVLVYGLSVVCGSVFVSKINVVRAVKNKKNHERNFLLLLLVKVVIVALAMINMSQLISQIRYAVDTEKDTRQLAQLDLSMAQTSVSPDEGTVERLNEIIAEIPDTEIFNYTESEYLYERSSIKENKDTAGEPGDNYIGVSDNLLPYLQIKDQNGKPVRSVDTGKSDVLLIPENKKDRQQEITEALGAENAKIYVIKSHQVYKDIMQPGLYAVNPVILVHRLQKTLWLNNGAVLYSKKGAALLQKKLDQMQIDEGSLRLQTMKNEYDVSIYNAQADVTESGLMMVMNAASYIMCMIAVTVIYLELRKKELGVYALFCRMPWNCIFKFLFANEVITVLLAVVIQPEFLWFAVIETVICIFVFWRYLRRKAVLMLKGE